MERKYPGSFSKGDKFHQGSNLHFRHYVMAVGLYRAHSRTQCVRNRLVAFATYDEFKDLPLAWCQFCDPRKNGVPLEDSSARLFRAVMDGSGTTAPVIPPRARSEARCDHSGPVQAINLNWMRDATTREG